MTSLRVPSRTIFSTRPYHSPLPSRWVIRIRFNVPIAGQAFWIADFVTLAVHECTGLPEWPSYLSALATR